MNAPATTEGPGVTAGFVSRTAASIVDVVIFAVLSAGMLFFLQAALALLRTEPFGDVVVPTALAGIAIGGLVFVYFAGSWAVTGRTAGEAILGLRVVRPDGGRVHLVRATVRCAVTFVSFAACGLGFAWMLVDRRRRTWQDIVAGTIVVYAFGSA